MMKCHILLLMDFKQICNLFADRNSEASESFDKTTLGTFYTNCMKFVDESAAVFPKMAQLGCQSDHQIGSQGSS